MTTAASLSGRTEGFVSGKSNPSVWQRAKRLFAYRRILSLLVKRDLKVAYAGSALGYLWTILEPLMLAFVFWFLFVKILKRNAGFDPYLLYLITGLLPWFWFSSSIGGCAKSLRAEAQMVRSTNVPRELWVVRVIVTNFMEYLFALPVLVIFAVAYMHPPTIYLLVLPLSMLIEFVMILGLGLILAPLTVMFKDLERFIPIVIRLGYYASPVLYSTTKLPKQYRFVYSFNPTSGFLELSHSIFFTQAMNWRFAWHSAAFAVIVLGIGVVVFRKLERTVLKEV